jgi:hypothetical protein
MGRNHRACKHIHIYKHTQSITHMYSTCDKHPQTHVHTSLTIISKTNSHLWSTKDPFNKQVQMERTQNTNT